MSQTTSNSANNLSKEETLEDPEEKNLTSLISQVVKSLRDDGHYIPESHVTFMGQLLRVEDYSVKNAADLAVKCRDAILILYDEVRDYEPSQHYHIFGNNGFLKVLKRRDQYGRKIVLMHWGKWHPEQLNCHQIGAALLLLFQHILKASPVTQRKGVILVNDMNGFGMKQFRALNLGMFKTVTTLAQTSTPAKVEGVHYIFTPRICDYLHYIINPFLKERLRSRVLFHSDVNHFYNHIGPEILPMSLGGKLGEVEALDNELHETFVEEGAEFVRQFVLDAVAVPKNSK